jgi:hypothetical protein
MRFLSYTHPDAVYSCSETASSKSFSAFDTVTTINTALAGVFRVCYLAFCNMGVTSIRVSQREQFLGQIDRLAGSSVLHSSESLCKLLRYLAKQAIDHPGEPAKEYQIATEVFGRPADFDPQLDSTIRVQAGRLRTKLAEYYAAEGADDSIIIELPKGSYHLAFRHRTSPLRPSANSSNSAEVTATATESRSYSRQWRIAALAFAILFAASLVSLVAILVMHKSPASASANGDVPVSEPLQTFWKPFLAGPDEPWVIFSNAAFVGRPEVGLRYYDPARDSKDLVFDHYTGVGEVIAVHSLDRVFDQLHRPVRVKRGSLFSLDDAKNNNLIFVGSPSENLTLTEIPGTEDFVFQRLTSGPRKGDLAIANVHPQGDEAKSFLASPSNSPLTEDYAVVALMQGLTQGQWVMILAGTTTFGTQGAVEYICRQSSAEELLLRLGVSKAGDIVPFEALLRVKVTRGVPVETQLVTLRKRLQ